MLRKAPETEEVLGFFAQMQKGPNGQRLLSLTSGLEKLKEKNWCRIQLIKI